MAGTLWSDVEASPWFPDLSPEEKAQTLDNWLGYALEREEDPDKALEISAYAEARKKNFFGEKVAPDQIFRPLVERRFATRQQVSDRYNQFTRGELQDPEMDELDQVFKDRVDAKVVNGSLFVKPSLIWDEEQYKEIVKNSGAPKVEQALALQEFKPLREQASKSMVESLALTDEDFKSFAESGVAAGKSNTAILDEWRTAMKLPEGIFGTIQGIGRQLSYGLGGGLAGLGRAGAGVGAILGVPGAQEAAAEAGKEAQSFAARRQVEGGPGFVGDISEGAVSLVPTIAVGAAGAALAPVTGGTSLALTSLAAGALTGGLQSAGASQADSYEYRRNIMGESPEQALAGSRYDAAASGLITTAVTAVSGKLGDKLGLGRGVEGLFRTPSGRAALRSGLRTGIVSTFTNATEEGIEEATDQLLQGVYERYSRDPNKDFQTILGETIQAGTIGATLGGGLTATRSALSSLFNRTPSATVEELEQELADRDAAKATPEAQNKLGKAANLSAAAVNAAKKGAPKTAEVTEKIAQSKVAEVNQTAKTAVNSANEVQQAERQLAQAQDEGVLMDVIAEERQRIQQREDARRRDQQLLADVIEQERQRLQARAQAPTTTESLPAGQAQAPAAGAETQNIQPQVPNAPPERQIPEDGQQERVNVDEGRPTAETGGGNRLVEGREVTQEDVTPAAGQGDFALESVTSEQLSAEAAAQRQRQRAQGRVQRETVPMGTPDLFEQPAPAVQPEEVTAPAVQPEETAAPTTQRDPTIPEQQTPAEREAAPREAVTEEWFFKTRKEAQAKLAYLVARFQRSPFMGLVKKLGLAPEEVYEVARVKNGWVIDRTAKNNVAQALSKRSPVSAEALDTYGLPLPEGYVRDGELYVYRLKAPTEAAAPAAQPEETAAKPAATRILKKRIANMTPKAQESWTPELIARAEQFFQNPEQPLGDVPVIKARAIRESYLESLPEADRAAQQARWEGEAKTAAKPTTKAAATLRPVLDVFAPDAVEKANTGFKSRSVIVDMAIDDFLEYAEPLAQEDRQEARDAFKAGIRWEDLPMLKIDERARGGPRVTGHEGRHRALVLKEAGYTTMPVVINSLSIRWSEQANPANSGYVTEFPTEVRSEDGTQNLPYPASRYSYQTQNETLRRFSAPTRKAAAPAVQPTPEAAAPVVVQEPAVAAQQPTLPAENVPQQPERMADDKFATFEAMVKARRAAGTLSKEMAAKYREQLELRGRTPAKPRVRAKKPTPGTKKPAGKSKRRITSDQKVADALAEFQRIARAAAREDQQAAGTGGIPVGTLKRSPALVAAAVKLTAALVDNGVVRFADFAEQVYSTLPDLWNSLKGIVLEAWQIESEFNDAMEVVDDETANAIYAEIESTPVETPVTPEPNLDTVEATIEDPAERTADPMNAPLGFGGRGRRNKSVSELLRAGETNYLFRTLFDDTLMREALGSNPAAVQRARDLVRGLEEYQSFVREQAASPAEWAERNAPFKEETDRALVGLRDAGFTASLDEDGRVLLSDVPKTYRPLLREFGFVWDTNIQRHVNPSFEKFLGFAQVYSNDRNGLTTELNNRSPDGRARARFQSSIASQKDDSALSATDVDEYLTTDTKETLFLGVGRMPLEAVVEQANDAALIVKAQQTGKPVFVLASGAGTGKTYVLGAALAEIRRRNPTGRILYITNNAKLIEQVRDKDWANFDVPNVEFATYSKMHNQEDFAPSPTDVLVLDEAHNVRYRPGDDVSPRAEIGAKWMEQAKFTILSSATPFESIEQMHFLWPTGVFEMVPEKPYGNAERGWFNFGIVTGGKVLRLSDGTPTSVKFPDNPTPQELLDNGTAARGFLEKNGMFVQRSSRIPEGNVESHFASVPAAPNWERMSAIITELARETSGLDWQTRAYLVNLLKRISEYAKIPAAIEQAKREIAEGRRVVIFLESKSERNRNLQALVGEWDEYQKAKLPVPDSFTPNIEGVIEFFRSLIGVGITEINFPSAQELFRQGLGEKNVAFYTGDEVGDIGEDSLGRWEAGEAPVLVATIARGGTGLSLHDQSEGGAAPRSQIVLTLPWRATETEQVAKRVTRYGMTSNARIFWLFSPNLSSETLLASRVGGRMQSMSTLVNGVVSEAGSTIQNWQFDPILNDFIVTPDSPLTAPSEGMVQLTKELNAYLSSESFPGRIVGPVTESQLEAGLESLSKLIPNIRSVTRIESRAALLRDPNLPEDAKKLVREGAQGFHYNGIAYVVKENVRQLIQHRTPVDAAKAVIFHELMHRGSKLLREAPQFRALYRQWQSMVASNVKETDLDNLVRIGYSRFSGWRNNAIKKAAAQEEFFVRKLEDLLNREGTASFQEAGVLRRFFNWLRSVLNKVFDNPPSSSLTDELLRDWGRKYVQALNGANTLARLEAEVQPSVAPVEQLPESEGTRRTPLDSYTDEQKAAILAFASKSNSNVKLTQILGMAESGNIGTSEQLAPLREAAMRTIGFTVGADGRPAVSASATANAQNIALQLLDPNSNFGGTYQSSFRGDSAATAVLQMELARYALAMLANGDSSLIGMLRRNWNSVMLGTYLSATAAGRVLRARSYYVSDVLSTLEEFESEQSQKVADYLGSLGVENPQTLLDEVEQSVRQASLDARQQIQLRDDLENNRNAAKLNELENDRNLWLRGIELMPDSIRSLYEELTLNMKELAFLEQQEQEMLSANAEPEASRIVGDVAEQQFARSASLEELRARREVLLQRNREVQKAFDAALRRKVRPAPTPEGPTDNEANTTVEDADEEGEGNEATEAAKTIIDELKAFLDKKYTAKAPPETAYTKIKAIIDRSTANVPEYNFGQFSDDIEAEVEGMDVDAEVLEELIAKAWSVYLRLPEKTAQKMAAEFEKIANGLVRQQKVEQTRVTKLKELARESMLNSKGLSQPDFVAQLTPKFQALGVPAADASRLAEWTYNAGVVRKAERRKRKIEGVKQSLFDGSLSRLVKRLEKATPADQADLQWRTETLFTVLKKSGLTDAEANELLKGFTDADFDSILKVHTGLADANRARSLQDQAQRLIKRYEELVKRPKTEQEKVREFKLETLARNQLKVPLTKDAFVAEAQSLGATEAQAERLYALTEEQRNLTVSESAQKRAQDLLAFYRQIGTRTKSAKEAAQDTQLVALVDAQIATPKSEVDFVAQATSLGLTEEQAKRVFRAAEPRSPTLLSKLTTYILSAPEAIRNVTSNRDLAIREFLKQNGLDDARIEEAMKWIGPQFNEYIKQAKQKALDAKFRSLESAKERANSRFATMSDSSMKQLQSDLKLIRAGLGDFDADPTQLFAQKLGYTGFRPEDYRTLAELDFSITRARESGMPHDMARGLKELYELLARRKMPKTFWQRMAISYNNSALSGLGTLLINIIAPMGSLAVRVGSDMARAIATGRPQDISAAFKILADSFKSLTQEITFSLVGGANINAMQQQVGRVTNLQPDFNAALKIWRDTKASPVARLKAGFVIAQSATDVTRRILATTDHTWYAVMQNYFVKTEALRVLTDAGIPRETSMPMLFARTQENGDLLTTSLNRISTVAKELDAAFKANPATLMGKLTEILEAPIDERLSESVRGFELDLRAALRRTAVAYQINPTSIHRHLMAELKLQQTSAYLRANDIASKQMLAGIQKLVDPTGDRNIAEQIEQQGVKESEYELGTHRGEKSPSADLANMATTLIIEAGSTVLAKNPIVGRMLLGYFGIPANLLNRALWFTPYGLIRYGIASKAMKTPEGRAKFYQQSMNSASAMRQRLVEAWLGTTATTVLLAIKALGDDEDEFFNVTLAGPVNKTEYDAWYKMGNRRGSIQLKIGDRVFSLNWARGPLEPLKVALMLVGAVDDMRLNRKLGDTGLQVSISDYLAAVLSGWSQQASFFGAKTTIGAVFSTQANAGVIGNLVYKASPLIPFSGLAASVERLIIGPDQFRGRETAVFANLPIFRSLLSERAVNALGDPLGTTLEDPFSNISERLWYAGLPFTIQKKLTGTEARIYQLFLDKGVAPGLPSRAALESKNGLMWDTEWLAYVERRGEALKKELTRNLARFYRMDEDSLRPALAELTSKATRETKRKLNLK